MAFDNELIKKQIEKKSEDIKFENDIDFNGIVSRLSENKDKEEKPGVKDNIIHDRYEEVLKNINSRTDIPTYLPLPGRARILKRAILKLINFEVTPRNIAQNQANAALRDGVKAAIGHNREQNDQINALNRRIDDLNGKIEVLEEIIKEGGYNSDNLRVFQFTSTLRRGDGVGNDVLAIHNYLKEKNIETRIYYESVIGTFSKDDARNINQLPPFRERDILLIHVAFAWDFIEKLIEFPGRKVFVYHNITPPEFFAPFDEGSAKACQLGLDMVKRLKDAPDYCLADSEFNKNDLISYGYKCPIDVLPIMIPFEDYDKDADEKTLEELNDGMTNILFVGRIAPNKKQEDIISAFACYQKNFNSNSRLILLGGYEESDLYYRSLSKYVEELGVKNVQFTTHIPFSQVIATIKSAHAFVCLSEHEGFCIPLLEAMHFEIPIVAYKSTAVEETLGAGGILIDKKDPATVACAMDMIVNDKELRKTISENQRKRLEDFTYDRITQRLWDWLVKYDHPESK